VTNFKSKRDFSVSRGYSIYAQMIIDFSESRDHFLIKICNFRVTWPISNQNVIFLVSRDYSISAQMIIDFSKSRDPFQIQT